MTVVDLTSAFDQVGAGGSLPGHFSFSSLSLALTCMESWRVRYLVGTRGPATTALAVGSGVHAGIAELYDTLAENPKAGKNTLLTNAKQAAMNALGDLNVADTVEVEETRTTTEHLLEVYATERPTHIKPLATEKRIEIALPDSDIPLIGFVDLEAERQIVEVKTSGRKVTVPTGAWKVQAWLYQAAIPKPVEWHVLVKQKMPLLITSAALAVPYDANVSRKAVSLASATLERIHKLYEERGPYEEWPTEGVVHPWACSTCDARAGCPVGGVA